MLSSSFHTMHASFFENPPSPSDSPDGPEFRVNTNTTGNQYYPTVCQIADGFVVAWSYVYGAYREKIVGQKYDVNGNAVGGEFDIFTSTVQFDQVRNPSICATSTGFVVSWEHFIKQANNIKVPNIKAQIFDINANKLGSYIQVSSVYTSDSQEQRNPALCKTSTGFMAAYTDESAYRIRVKRYDLNGTQIGSTYTLGGNYVRANGHPSFCNTSAGCVLVWDQISGQYKIFGQRFTTDGTLDGSTFTASSSGRNKLPSVCQTSSGFAVSWHDESGLDGSSWGVFAQRFDVNANKLGGQFQVNTHTGSKQYSTTMCQTTAGFVVAWTSDGQDGNGNGVFAQKYANDGTPIDNEFQVNTHTSSQQQLSSAAQTNNGFVVVWESLNQDGNGYGIFGQKYNVVPII